MEWWDKGQNIYVENYTKQGFVLINNPSDIKEHDAFLIQLISSVPNHAAIYIGEGLIMHHVMGRLSSRDVYGGYWRKHTTHHLRHKSLC